MPVAKMTTIPVGGMSEGVDGTGTFLDIDGCSCIHPSSHRYLDCWDDEAVAVVESAIDGIVSVDCTTEEFLPWFLCASVDGDDDDDEI